MSIEKDYKQIVSDVHNYCRECQSTDVNGKYTCGNEACRLFDHMPYSHLVRTEPIISPFAPQVRVKNASKPVYHDYNSYTMPRYQGRKEYLAYREGQKVTMKERILGKCYECLNFMVDGNKDCGQNSCPLYGVSDYHKTGVRND